MFAAYKVNWTELRFANSLVNSQVGTHNAYVEN